MLAKFLFEGVIGPLRVGLPKSEVLSLVGPPSEWKGRPGSLFGGKLADYNDSSEWYCNGVHIVIEEGVIDEICLWIHHPYMNWSSEWLRDWPLSMHPKQSEVRDFLDEKHIPFAIAAPSGGYGFDIVLFESYILGASRRDAKLEDVDLHGIVRVKDSRAVPNYDIPVGIEELNPKRTTNKPWR
jgi:hypothetical protein